MNRTALLVIDAQNDMLAEGNAVYNARSVLDHMKQLLADARKSGTSIYYIQHNEPPESGPLVRGTQPWQIHSELTPENDDALIHKTMPNAFDGTDLHEHLQQLGIQQLVLAGMQSEYCVEATCRGAVELGYTVTLVKDAHSTWDSGGNTASAIIDRCNKELGSIAAVKTTEEISFGNL
ncbi:cysteine hydrolase family protein [Paenibacillus sp. NPDC058174]|uniref:cysteine hydrolase family protein n=1 Tax=Paenibacillus sp. NPDC058174 TaxID=3346366 RepID=UPI0036D997B4